MNDFNIDFWLLNDEKSITVYDNDIARVTSIEEAVFIRRILYLWKKFDKQQIFIIPEKFCIPVGISIYSFRKIVKKWEDTDLIKTGCSGLPQKKYYLINEENLSSYLNKLKYSDKNYCNQSYRKQQDRLSNSERYVSEINKIACPNQQDSLSDSREYIISNIISNKTISNNNNKNPKSCSFGNERVVVSETSANCHSDKNDIKVTDNIDKTVIGDIIVSGNSDDTGNGDYSSSNYGSDSDVAVKDTVNLNSSGNVNVKEYEMTADDERELAEINAGYERDRLSKLPVVVTDETKITGVVTTGDNLFGLDEIDNTVVTGKRKAGRPKKTEDTVKSAKLAPAIVFEIYNAYPLKVARKRSLEAIKNAIDRLIEEGEHDARWLLQRVKDYDSAVCFKEKQFIPYPATWFNRESYYDDDKVWDTTPESQKSERRKELEYLCRGAEGYQEGIEKANREYLECLEIEKQQAEKERIAQEEYEKLMMDEYIKTFNFITEMNASVKAINLKMPDGEDWEKWRIKYEEREAKRNAEKQILTEVDGDVK